MLEHPVSPSGWYDNYARIAKQMTTFLNILVMLFFGAVFFGIMTGIWWIIQRINAWTRPPPVRKRERD